MKLVRKTGERIEASYGQITDQVARALKATYDGTGSSEQAHTAIELIKSARANDFWIECDCQHTEAPQALLAPVHLKTKQPERFYLARLTHSSRPTHSDDCPFYLDPAENSLLNKNSDDNRTPLLKPSDNLRMLTLFTENPTLAKINDPTAPTTSFSYPKTMRALLYLLERSNLNVIYPIQQHPKRTNKSQRLLQKLTLQANLQGLYIAPPGADSQLGQDGYGAMSLAQVITFNPEDVHTDGLSQRLLGETVSWRPGLPPQGFLIACAHNAGDKEAVYIIDEDNNRQVSLNLAVGFTTKGALNDDEREGPYLTFIICGQTEDTTEKLIPLNGHAHMIVAEDLWFPVNSVTERLLVNSLIDIQQEFYQKWPVLEMAISRIVFDFKAADGKWIMPDLRIDFVNQATGQHRILFIDIIGCHAEGYDDVKMKNIDRLRTVGPVLVITRDQVIAAQKSLTDLAESILHHSKIASYTDEHGVLHTYDRDAYIRPTRSVDLPSTLVS